MFFMRIAIVATEIQSGGGTPLRQNNIDLQNQYLLFEERTAISQGNEYKAWMTDKAGNKSQVEPSVYTYTETNGEKRFTLKSVNPNIRVTLLSTENFVD
jgi:hypothetical protein